jgi:hypothetical protein
MALHDWDEAVAWEGLRLSWNVELLRAVKLQLPAGYRAYLRPVPSGPTATNSENDTLLCVETQHRLVAAVELISPRNKDRLTSRASYLSRYLGYLLEGVHLLLVDVHRRPLDFSFADQIAGELRMDRPPCPAPFAVSYRVGEQAATGGRLLAVWRRLLTPGQALPELPLPLTVEMAVPVDLEGTYSRAAADAYLS